MIIVRTDEEVDDLLNELIEAIDRGRSRFRGMSYEQGIEAAIRWLVGETDDHPYPKR